MNRIGISIIIATFNRPKDTSELVKSINKAVKYYKQKTSRDPKIELIIADNSLNDETKKELDKYKYEYIRYIRLEPYGITFVRDFSVSKAKYDYILFTDSDCIVKKNWIYLFFKSIEKNELPDLIQGGYFYPYKNDWYSKSEAEWDKIRFYKQKQADCRNILIKKQAYRKIGGFDKNHFYAGGAEDLFLMERLRDINAKIVFDEDLIVYHKYPSLYSELKRYEGYGKAAIHIKFKRKELFEKEFSPHALWRNLFTFRFGRISLREFFYQYLKIAYFTKGYFKGKRHYLEEIRKDKIISPYL